MDLDGKFIRVNARIIFNFGKYRGRRLDEIAQEAPGYLQWMLGGNFLDDTKVFLSAVLERTNEAISAQASLNH